MRVRLHSDVPTAGLAGLDKSGVVLGVSGGYLAVELDSGMVVSAQADEWKAEPVL